MNSSSPCPTVQAVFHLLQFHLDAMPHSTSTSTSTPSRPPPQVLPSHATGGAGNPSSLEAASLALSPYRSVSASSSSHSGSTRGAGGATSPPPQLHLPVEPLGSFAAAEEARVLQSGRVERARRGWVVEAEAALEAVQACRREVARVRGEVEAVFDQLTAGSAPLSLEQDAVLEARALELAIPVEAGLVFEYMQLKEIDKEAAQAALMRATPENAAAAELAHKALLPARLRLESYRKAFAVRLDKADEAYGREAADLSAELAQLGPDVGHEDHNRLPQGSAETITPMPVTPLEGEAHMIEFAEHQDGVPVASPVSA